MVTRSASPVAEEPNGAPANGTRNGAIAAWKTSREAFEGKADPFHGGGGLDIKNWDDGASTGLGVSALLMSLGGDRKLTRPYLQNPWVYACIQANARAMASLPVQILDRKGSEATPIEAPTHSLVKLFDAPNPLQSQAKLLKQLTNYHLLWGETYLILMRSVRTPAQAGRPAQVTWRPVEAVEGEGMMAKVETPEEIWPVAGHLVQEVVDKEHGPLPHKYRVRTGNGTEEYPAHAVVQLADANPHSVLRGVGAMTAVLRDAAKGYQLDRYDDAILKNGGTPGGTLQLDGAIPDEELRAIREAWREAHERPDSHRKTAILSHGTKYVPHGFTPQEMEFETMRDWIRQTIMAVFGVTKPILGITDDVNRANSREAYRVFWETTIIPLVRFFEDELNFKLVRRVKEWFSEGVYWSLDLDGVEALREDMDAKVDRTIKLYKEGHRTFNEAARLAGWDLGEQEVEGADERWVQTTLVPAALANLASSPQEAPESPQEPSEPESGPDTQPDAPNAPGASQNVSGGDAAANPKATLNGAQIASLLEIITAVATGTLSLETAVQVIVAAFPFDESRAREILADVEPGGTPAPASPAPPPPPSPDGDEEPDEESDDDDAEELAAGRARSVVSKLLLATAREDDTPDRDATLAAYWRNYDEFLRGREETMQRVVAAEFKRFLDDVEDTLDEIASSDVAQAAGAAAPVIRYTVTEAELARILKLNLDVWNASMLEALTPQLVGTMLAAAQQIHFEVGGAGSVLAGTDPIVLDILATAEVKIAEGYTSNLAQSLQRKMVAVLADAPGSPASLAQAIAETLQELKGEVSIMRDQAGRRAMMIARTEVNAASSAARFEQMRADGIKEHTWVTSGDEQVRESHVELNGRKRALGDTFGHGLRYPGDKNGAAAEVINCRCTVIPELPSSDED